MSKVLKRTEVIERLKAGATMFYMFGWGIEPDYIFLADSDGQYTVRMVTYYWLVTKELVEPVGKRSNRDWRWKQS
jgi:hypothetical protein